MSKRSRRRNRQNNNMTKENAEMMTSMEMLDAATEMVALFNAIDSFQPYPGNGLKYKPEIILPVLFRMMYCCGMRPAEPLHLRNEDVDTSNGDIYIRETKVTAQ